VCNKLQTFKYVSDITGSTYLKQGTMSGIMYDTGDGNSPTWV